MNYTTQIGFSDLSSDAQEYIVTGIKDILREQLKEEGETQLKRGWHSPTPTTAEEAYVRSMSIDYILWTDYEAGEDEDRPDFEEIFEEHITSEAEKLADKQVRNLLIDVEVI